MHLLPVNALTYWIHSLTHRIRCALSPAYADEAALARDADALEFLRECHANDSSLDLALAQFGYSTLYRDAR